MTSEKVHLPGLNGFRAIAALAVVFSHINLNLAKYGLEQGSGLQLANFGVTIFFTLSGFLITYLLLREKDKTGSISIKKFYVRRVLRIWPLYFLYILLVLVFNWQSTANPTLLYYAFFIPNVAFALSLSLPMLTHYWSLGVEEQFYIFWPWVVKKVGRLPLFLILFIVVFLLLKVAAKYIETAHVFGVFLHYTRFGCMAIGALGAYYWTYWPEKIKIACNPWVESLSWLVLGLVFVNKFHIFSIIDHELVAFFSVLLMINQVKGKPMFSLEKPAFDYFGKISFGLYVYNPLVIHLVAKGFSYWHLEQNTLYVVPVYVLTPLAIIGVAHVSYQYFEKPFLNIKDRFSVVASSNTRIES